MFKSSTTSSASSEIAIKSWQRKVNNWCMVSSETRMCYSTWKQIIQTSWNAYADWAYIFIRVRHWNAEIRQLSNSAVYLLLHIGRRSNADFNVDASLNFIHLNAGVGVKCQLVVCVRYTVMYACFAHKSKYWNIDSVLIRHSVSVRYSFMHGVFFTAGICILYCFNNVVAKSKKCNT